MDDKILTSVTLALDKGETLNISKKKKNTKPGFIMIGSGTTNKHNVTSIDLLHEIAEMTASEKYAFFLVKDNIVFDPYDSRFIYQVKVPLPNPTEKSKFSRGYTTLVKKDLIRRISKGVYMINPYALVPNDFPEELAIWEGKQMKTIEITPEEAGENEWDRR